MSGKISRRGALAVLATAPIVTACAAGGASAATRTFTVDARPNPLEIDAARTAVIVVDMQNDFGATGGMFERAGIDISGIRAAVAPTARVLTAARAANIKIVYLKMGYRPDLSDLGAPDAVNRTRHMRLNVGASVTDPHGRPSRILVRDTWNTDIVDELAPQEGEAVLYKTRFSGFYRTELDNILRRHNVSQLVFTGCTTSICVESTVRDAMFRDYQSLLLSDCMSEPIGDNLPRSNHEASLLSVEVLLGWVSDSTHFIQAVQR